jgi:hypothetical protein
VARGGCACGAVRFEIDVPAVWAWHDHSRATRRAHGAASATFVGTWKSRFRLLEGEDQVRDFREEATGAVRSFCVRCGAPLFYERAHAPKILNIPRALFDTGVGREPRYHVGVEETPEWAYAGARLRPLKGYPGVTWEGSGRRKRAEPEGLF